MQPRSSIYTPTTVGNTLAARLTRATTASPSPKLRPSRVLLPRPRFLRQPRPLSSSTRLAAAAGRLPTTLVAAPTFLPPTSLRHREAEVAPATFASSPKAPLGSGIA